MLKELNYFLNFDNIFSLDRDRKKIFLKIISKFLPTITIRIALNTVKFANI